MRTLRLAVGMMLLAGCAAAPSLTIPDAQTVQVHRLDTLLAAQPLAEGQNIRATLLGRTESMSYHLVQIRDREAPHVHASHDLAVTLLHGKGVLFVRGAPHAMRGGDVAVVPHGTPHFFVNTDTRPAAAFVTFAPPYDGTDQVPINP